MQPKRKKVLLGMFACMMAGMFLVGCGANSNSETRQNVDGLKELGTITVLSREEGSGTRSVFAQMIGFANNSDSDKPDQTREDARILENADEIVETIKEDVTAIGYVSSGSIEEYSGIKALQIDGKSLSGKDKSYPLSRTFYIAYAGSLSELERDFITYIQSAGQDIVSKNYETIAKSTSFLSNKEKGTIHIGGSTSVAPLMEELAEAYMQINPNAVIEVEATDSGDGLTKAMSKTYDLGMSSRDLKDYEKELLEYEAIASDKIALIVNEKNPLENITSEQLKKIYTGEISDWEELNQ